MAIDVNIIRQSFEKAKPIAGEVMNKFYENLWTDYPQSKALFDAADMEKQKKALTASLVYVVDHLDQTEKLVKYLKGLGARHNNYGTLDEHYDWVGGSLLKTFEFFFKSAWTDELKQQWTEAYGIIAQTMKDGAKEAKKAA